MHVGIILDGNRRWAKERGMPTLMGHTKGFDKVTKLMEWAKEMNIKELSLYCFSIQNFNRTDEEKKYLFNLFRKQIDILLKDPKVEEEKMKVRFAGRIEMFPEDIQEKMKELMEKTTNHDNFIVNFAMAYGGREEIVDAVKKLQNKGIEITEENIQQNMWVPENMDVVIRTSGEFRLSNFFIWQANYAEYFFLKKYWPAFEKEDLERVVNEFKAIRERRFGK